jgi:hypothetical protein
MLGPAVVTVYKASLSGQRIVSYCYLLLYELTTDD